MTSSSSRHIIAGSERQPMPGATASTPIRPDERFEVTLRLRPKTAPAPHASAADVPPLQRDYLSREQFAAAHGADPADIAKVAAFAAAHGLQVVASDPARRSVVLSGPCSAMCPAFEVELHHYEHAGGSYRGRVGTVSVPADLGPIVEGVFGLDNRPQADPHFQFRPSTAGARPTADTSFTPTTLAQLYDFPSGLDGAGQCIGIIELGGGYRPADLKTYFVALGLTAPAVKAVSVDHGRNAPSTASGADGEVMLDIEVAGSVAPKASLAVYFAPNTSQGFLDAVTTAVHDAVNKPSVISISWGSAEASWTPQAMTQFDQAFQAAAAMGVTVLVAAGDAGSGDGVADGQPHVDFPASSPNVTGCGGTRLAAAGGRITSEVVWNEGTASATGGGVSGFFALPAYQQRAGVPALPGAARRTGRGVPDVAGNADPASGYQVRVDGQDMVIGGTSAVAPLWAGLVALLNQRLGRPVGFLNPLIYGSLSGQGLFKDITSGSNGTYRAGPGWDACTGWGSPDGSRLLAALSATTRGA